MPKVVLDRQSIVALTRDDLPVDIAHPLRHHGSLRVGGCNPVLETAVVVPEKLDAVHVSFIFACTVEKVREEVQDTHLQMPVRK